MYEQLIVINDTSYGKNDSSYTGIKKNELLARVIDLCRCAALCDITAINTSALK